MPRQSGIGQVELEVLQYIAGHESVSIGEAAEHFAATRGYARTTVKTMMERLRNKGYLSRKKAPGAYRYFSRQAKSALLHRLVKDFVERSLGGSLAPFAAYLAGRSDLTGKQRKELEELIASMEAQHRTESQKSGRRGNDALGSGRGE